MSENSFNIKSMVVGAFVATIASLVLGDTYVYLKSLAFQNYSDFQEYMYSASFVKTSLVLIYSYIFSRYVGHNIVKNLERLEFFSVQNFLGNSSILGFTVIFCSLLFVSLEFFFLPFSDRLVQINIESRVADYVSLFLFFYSSVALPHAVVSFFSKIMKTAG
jgi:hypothetical protein